MSGDQLSIDDLLSEDSISALERRILAEAAHVCPQAPSTAEGNRAVDRLVDRGLGRVTRCDCEGCPMEGRRFFHASDAGRATVADVKTTTPPPKTADPVELEREACARVVEALAAQWKEHAPKRPAVHELVQEVLAEAASRIRARKDDHGQS